MFGVFALESPYIEKNKDWSSHTSHRKFGDSCPIQYAYTNKNSEKRYAFKFYVFNISQLNSINYICILNTKYKDLGLKVIIFCYLAVV